MSNDFLNYLYLGVDGVDSEHEGGEKTSGGTDVVTGHNMVEEAHHHVELEVDQVVAQGREAVKEVVQSERENAERSVGFVRLLLVHW